MPTDQQILAAACVLRENFCHMQCGCNWPCGLVMAAAKDALVAAEQSKRKLKRPLPEDFIPDRTISRSLNWPENKIDQEIQKFFDYARAHNKLYADWDAAWRNWCRSPFQQKENTNGHEHSASAAAGRLAEKAERGEFTFSPRPSLLPAESPDDVRLLPKG